MQQLRVSDLMRVCPTAVIAEAASLREAAELLVVNDHSVLMVQDETERITGLLCENAVVRELMRNSDPSVLVEQAMSRHIETVRSDALLNGVLHLFRSSCHSVIPVVDDNDTIVGQLLRSDVVRYLLDDGPVEVPQLAPKQKPHFMKKARRKDSSDNEKS